MQIKTTKRYHYTHRRMARIQNTDRQHKCWRGYGATRALIHCWWECKIVQPFWKTLWQFLIKLNTLSPYDLAITLLSICPELLKTYIHTKTCTWMFIAALFIIAQIWKQPGCSSVGEWVYRDICRQWNITQH